MTTISRPGRAAGEPYLTQVSPGAFAYVQPDGGWCLSNSGVLTGTSRTVIVDTAATMSRARRLRRVAGTVSQSAETAVVNTHHHGDHFFGNCVYEANTTIIAHDLARPEMEHAGLGLQQLWPDVDWGEVALTLPNLTFSDRLTLHNGGLVAELFHVGPAHTTNDVVVWLPEARVLFAGDVLFNGVTPFALMGSVAGSIAAVERLRALGPAVIVPGHGGVGGPELLDQNAAYLNWLSRLAADGFAAGLSPLELAKEADLGEFAVLVDSERVVGNLVRAYSELRGETLGAPLDVLAAFQLMIDYHGGLPACFALVAGLAVLQLKDGLRREDGAVEPGHGGRGIDAELRSQT